MDKKTVLILAVLLFCVFIVLHHYYIHRFDVKSSNIEKWFRREDVNNHETVMIGFLGFALGLIASSWFKKS